MHGRPRLDRKEVCDKRTAPSRTALATSLTSARVGRGLVVIVSSICVAQMMGLPLIWHLEIIIFCARKTFSAGISMPRSPRATITPSVTSSTCTLCLS
jgi:hypothetical protein